MKYTIVESPGEPAELGHPNSPLPNMKEISLEEWTRHQYWTYMPVATGYRQITRIEELRAIGIAPPKFGTSDQIMPIRWFQMHDKTGIAVHNDWHNKKLRVFAWAVCEHEDVGRKLGNCYYEYTCKKCGYKHTVDSSD
jgi:hypothetical protein